MRVFSTFYWEYVEEEDPTHPGQYMKAKARIDVQVWERDPQNPPGVLLGRELVVLDVGPSGLPDPAQAETAIAAAKARLAAKLDSTLPPGLRGS